MILPLAAEIHGHNCIQGILFHLALHILYKCTYYLPKRYWADLVVYKMFQGNNFQKFKFFQCLAWHHFLIR